MVGEGEVEVARGIERDAECEAIRPGRVRESLELDARRLERGAGAEGGGMGPRAAAGAGGAKPPWSRAVRSHGKVVVDGGRGAHRGNQLPASLRTLGKERPRPPCIYFIRLSRFFQKIKSFCYRNSTTLSPIETDTLGLAPS